MSQYRQGDVLIEKVDRLPQNVTAVPRDQGRVVLAYGEVTGHAHAFGSTRATLFREDGSGGGLFLTIAGDEPAALEHEEHEAIQVPPGTYRVVRQREYTPLAIRRVAD